MFESTNLLKLKLFRRLNTPRCLLFVWQISLLNAFSEFVNMERNGHRYVIQYFHLKGLSSTNIKAEPDSTMGESAPSFTTIKYWVAEFKRCCMSCQNEHRSGRSNEVIMTEMVEKIRKMVLDDRNIYFLRDGNDWFRCLIGLHKWPIHSVD